MMHVRPALFCVALSAATLFSATACSALEGARYQELVHTRVSSMPKALKVTDPVGTVRIKAWKNPYVQIDAVKRAPSQDALHSITISVQPNGDTLDISGDLGGSGSRRSIDFTIHAPSTTNLNVHSNTGKVDLTGFTGDVNVDASVGKISVDMAALRKGQQVAIDSSVGAIDLTIPHDSDATIDAETSVGSVSGDGLAISRETVGAKGHGVLGAGGAQVSITASTGSIHINRE
jgi:Putative adhesin